MQLPRQTGDAGRRQGVLVAVCLQEGVTLLLLQKSEGWGGGGVGYTGMSVHAGEPGWVSNCPVFLAEPTWIWK